MARKICVRWEESFHIPGQSRWGARGAALKQKWENTQNSLDENACVMYT